MTRRRTDPTGISPPARPPTRPCAIDGSPLDAQGRCQKTGGYPYGTKCPFVCPTCRQALAWDGRCAACRNYPGERWDCYFDDLQPISDGHHLHRLGPSHAVVYAVSDPPPAPPPDQPPTPAPTVAQTYACALAYEACALGLIPREVALDTYAEVFAHPERAEDVIAFYRAKIRTQRPSSRPTGAEGPERLGDILRRGPVIDPAVRALLNRPTAAPEVTHAEP
jgi:hypothetical protein